MSKNVIYLHVGECILFKVRIMCILTAIIDVRLDIQVVYSARTVVFRTVLCRRTHVSENGMSAI